MNCRRSVNDIFLFDQLYQPASNYGVDYISGNLEDRM